MDIAFDPAKDAINRAKHGVSLTFGEWIWSDDAVVPTIRIEDGERRFSASIWSKGGYGPPYMSIASNDPDDIGQEKQ